MFILQTLKEFMDNPMGKGSTAIPNRKLISDDFAKRYNKLIKTKKFEHTVYKDGDDYYFHIKVPSESERNNTYDVVLHFTQGEESFHNDNFLNRYYVKFFSNCPSFTFTFAYVFNLYGLLIESLPNKYRDEVLEDDPITRNPGEIISYEKSTYFACYHIMQNNRLMNKMYLNSVAKPYIASEFNELIRTDDRIKLEIEKENQRISREKQKEKENKKEEPKSNNAVKSSIGKDIDKVSGRAVNNTIRRISPMKKTRATKHTGPNSGVNYIRPK
jgi:hypothetical protein